MYLRNEPRPLTRSHPWRNHPLLRRSVLRRKGHLPAIRTRRPPARSDTLSLSYRTYVVVEGP